MTPYLLAYSRETSLYNQTITKNVILLEKSSLYNNIITQNVIF